jgi:hypothetical protein
MPPLPESKSIGASIRNANVVRVCASTIGLMGVALWAKTPLNTALPTVAEAPQQKAAEAMSAIPASFS